MIQLTPNKTANRMMPLFKLDSNREKRIPTTGKISTLRRNRNWQMTYKRVTTPNR